VILKEERRNLFEVDEKYYLAHCISADAEMGAGIAVEFAKKFPKIKMLKNYSILVGVCVKVDRIFNLVTKSKYYGKPTYFSLIASLEECRDICIENNIKYLAMPKIGCGLDRLSWGKVREIVQEVFKNTDIEILVCYL
jgi:hypothetical protein